MNTEIDTYNQRKRHHFRIFLSCLVGSVLGHSILFTILKANGTESLSLGIGEITQSGVIWSGVIFTAFSFALKFLLDCVNFLNRPAATPSSKPKVATAKTAPDKLESALRRMEESETERLWKGFRPFVVDRKEYECPDKSICSFYLKPYDNKWLPIFKPGQYLTFRLDNMPGQSKSIIRCYSLSDRVNGEYYRVSIKRVPAPKDKPELPPGLSSNYFHDHIKVGDVLDVKAPSGHFNLNQDSRSGVVLIAGGVGFTPMVSMLNTLLEANEKRDIWFYYGLVNSEQHAMKEYLEEIVQNHDHVHLIVCYSRPTDYDEEKVDYQFKGRVGIQLMKDTLPSNNFEYYMCGPGPMMADVVEGLKSWGVPDNDIYYEAFGPASVPKAKKKSIALDEANVRFEQSDENVKWQGEEDSLLDLALNAGIDMAFGCKMGNCGSCETALLNGEVDYPAGKPGFDAEKGNCLPCVCVPKGDIVLDV